MKHPKHYQNYVGQYVKRFYEPFKEENICFIAAFMEEVNPTLNYRVPMFLYRKGEDEWWADCEDSCIITNELPIKEIDWVANTNSPEYKGYNPFTQNIQ